MVPDRTAGRYRDGGLVPSSYVCPPGHPLPIQTRAVEHGRCRCDKGGGTGTPTIRPQDTHADASGARDWRAALLMRALTALLFWALVPLPSLAPSPLPTAVPYGQQAGFSDGNVLPVLANPDRGLSAIRNSGPQQEPKATGNGSKALYAAAAWDNALRLARLAVAPPRDGAAPDAGFDAFSARAPPAEV